MWEHERGRKWPREASEIHHCSSTWTLIEPSRTADAAATAGLTIVPYAMNESLRGKQIILAGGSGGIGAACVELLAQEGASLVVSYRQNAARAERFREMATLVQADLLAGADRRKL